MEPSLQLSDLDSTVPVKLLSIPTEVAVTSALDSTQFINTLLIGTWSFSTSTNEGDGRDLDNLATKIFEGLKEAKHGNWPPWYQGA